MRKQIRSTLAAILAGAMVLTSVSPAVYAGEPDSTFVTENTGLPDGGTAPVLTTEMGNTQLSQDISIEEPSASSEDLSGENEQAPASSEDISGGEETASAPEEASSEPESDPSPLAESEGESAFDGGSDAAADVIDPAADTGAASEGSDLFGENEIVAEEDAPEDGIEEQTSDLVQDAESQEGMEEEAVIETVTLSELLRKAPAAEGTLQAIINQALIDSVMTSDPGADPTDDSIPKTADVRLDRDWAECITIPDNCTVTLDLCGHTIAGAREEDDTGTLSSITVFGSLTLTDSSSGSTGSLDGSAVEDIRGIDVKNKGILTLESGTIKGYSLSSDSGSNGAGILVEKGGSFLMKGGVIEKNTTAYYGGGLFVSSAKALKIAGGIFRENSAKRGGAAMLSGFPETTGFGTDPEKADLVFLENLTVENNTASESGGGFYIGLRSGNETSTMSNVTFTGNKAVSTTGGAVCYSSGGAKGTITLNSVTIKNNSAGQYHGGIYFRGGSTVSLYHCAIEYNEAGKVGGGLGTDSDSTFDITDSSISCNKITGTIANRYGAGIYSWDRTKITLNGDSLKIDGNTGAGSGGGIYCHDSGQITLSGGEIADNTVRPIDTDRACGGGICMNSGAFKMEGGVICNNNARNLGNNTEANGGGIWMQGTATIHNGVIENNTASNEGGGIAASGVILEETGEDSKVLIQNNRANRGGGIRAHVTMRSGTITGNSAGDYGGGISGNATISGGTIEKNSARVGGGISSDWLNMTGGEVKNNTASGAGGGISANSISMTGGVITGNSSRSGGGLRVFYNATIKDAIITNNSAWDAGGGIASNDSHEGTIKIADTKISGNSSATGGGIYVTCAWRDASVKRRKTMTLSAGTIVSGNRASGYGGGVYLHNGAQCILDGGSITDNTAEHGGGGVLVTQYNDKLEVRSGSLRNNTARWGRDISLVNYYANQGNHLWDPYHRPVLILADTTKNMTPAGVWQNEAKKDTIYTEYDNTAENAELEKADQEQADKWNADNKYQRTYTNYTLNLTYTSDVPQEQVARVAETVYPSVQEAIEAVKAASDAAGASDSRTDGSDGSQDIDRTVVLLVDHTESVTVPEDLVCTLDLNGHVLSGDSSSVISIAKGADFTLRDSSEEKTGAVTKGKGQTYHTEWGDRLVGGGLFVAGKARLLGGTIYGSDLAGVGESMGGGVFVAAGGDLVVDGAEIRSNGAVWGGGIYIYNGTAALKSGTIHGNRYSGVFVAYNKGVFNMEGGSIYSNTADNNYDRKGGGVTVLGGRFNFSGGEIYGNKTTTDRSGVYAAGGGVNVRYWGSLYMTGGTIRDNLGGNGGGIFSVDGGYVNISGGTITGNESRSGSGGGAYISPSGHLQMTGGVITGNTCSDVGGGICYNSADHQRTNRFFDLEGGQVYGNTSASTSTNSLAADIYLCQGARLKKLMAASDMQVENVDCWRDGYDLSELTEALVGSADTSEGAPETKPEDIVPVTQHAYYLTAAKKHENRTEDAVARIGDVTYASIQDAVDAAGEIVTAEDGTEVTTGTTIYLLRNWKETVSVSGGKNLTFDLNGYTLNPEKKSVFDIAGESSLTVRSTGTDKDTNQEESALKGWITTLDPETEQAKASSDDRSDKYSGTRAFVVMRKSTLILEDGVTVDGFGGDIYGGAVHARYGSTVDIRKGATIQNCHASYGGAVYIQAVSANPASAIHFLMSGGTINNCSAAYDGGAVYYKTRDSAIAPDEFKVSGGSFENNYARRNGGAILFYGRNVNTAGSDTETVSLTDASFTGNVSDGIGSAAYADLDARGNELTISGCTFQYNDTYRQGTVYVRSTDSGRKLTLNFNNNSVESNTSRNSGAGLWVNNARVLMDGCTFTGNKTTGKDGRSGVDNSLTGQYAALYVDTGDYSEDMRSAVKNASITNLMG